MKCIYSLALVMAFSLAAQAEVKSVDCTLTIKENGNVTTSEFLVGREEGFAYYESRDIKSKMGGTYTVQALRDGELTIMLTGDNNQAVTVGKSSLTMLTSRRIDGGLSERLYCSVK